MAKVPLPFAPLFDIRVSEMSGTEPFIGCVAIYNVEPTCRIKLPSVGVLVIVRYLGFHFMFASHDQRSWTLDIVMFMANVWLSCVAVVSEGIRETVGSD